MSKFREKVQGIVNEIDHGYCETSHDHDADKAESINQLIELIEKEIIGEDETDSEERIEELGTPIVRYTATTPSVIGRNKLRAEIRKKLK